MEAARTFADRSSTFEVDESAPLFREGPAISPVTYWPSGYVNRIR
jgi:hypothetical protein